MQTVLIYLFRYPCLNMFAVCFDWSDHKDESPLVGSWSHDAALRRNDTNCRPSQRAS